MRPTNRDMSSGGLSRREALRRGLLGVTGLALSDGLHRAGAGPLDRRPAPPVKAKAVIQIWMWGGPCHLDTFDPKPEAGHDYCGPLKNPIRTKVRGIRICELLPKLAEQADKYAILRGMTHGINSHETASYRVQTGHEPGRLVYPSLGAVVSRFRGVEAGYKGLVPPYIVLTQPQGRFSEAGFLGPRYKPFATGGDPKQTPFAVEGIVARGITDKRQRDRRRLLEDLDTLGQVLPDDPELQALDTARAGAYDLMFGKARELFDLSQESEAMRERYGLSTFGQACLVARRLVAHGVPYITINYKGWDTHKQHFELMQRNLPVMDQALAALLQDLDDWGLLQSTIVWWGGEFGRSPKILWKAPWNGGRSHYGKAFCHLVAGGGFRGGQVVGATNDTGTEVKERPIYPEDLLASMCTQLGIDPQGPLPNERNLDVPVMPATETSGGLLTEIM